MTKGPGERPAPHDVVLRMTLRPGEPLAGSLTVEGNADGWTFSGWLELMAAVNAARRPKGDGRASDPVLQL